MASSTCVSRCPRVLSLFSVAPSSIGGFSRGRGAGRGRPYRPSGQIARGVIPCTKRSRNPELLRALIIEPVPFARHDCFSHSGKDDNAHSRKVLLR